jgi:hypothetical protein
LPTKEVVIKNNPLILNFFKRGNTISKSEEKPSSNVSSHDILLGCEILICSKELQKS